MAPVFFRLGVDFRRSVDFRGTGKEEASFYTLGESQHVIGAEEGGFQRFDGIGLVVSRRGGAGEVVDLIDFEEDGVNYVMTSYPGGGAGLVSNFCSARRGIHIWRQKVVLYRISSKFGCPIQWATLDFDPVKKLSRQITS